ncbi:MAG: trimethylamine methyltransferase family protein [Anaerolineae bacterium]|nr:trimethylamine methyltransferase family protein [Anaerolineae bacterium]
MIFTPHLTQKEAAKIHAASLKVLARTGVKVDHEEAIALLLDAGASKDDEGRLLIPALMVEEALEKARASSAKIQLFTRDGEPAILLKNGETYFGPGSDALEIRDLDTGEFRAATLADVAANVTIADALGFDFMMSMALPRDIDHVYPTVYFYMIRHTRKPTVVTFASFKALTQTYHIAALVAGGEKCLRQKPTLLGYVDPISPLYLDREGTTKLLFLAEKGYPCLFAAGANCGATAPITIEGAVNQGNAEFLAGLVVATLKNEGARLVSGANSSAMDMRTSAVCYGAPEWARTVALYAGLGKFYNLPSWGFAGGSDAVEPNFQAGLEAYESILLALQTESTLVHDMGYLKRGYLYDARMLVLSQMMVERARSLLKSFDLTEEGLAGRVINDVAREKDGVDNYPAHPHTYQHFSHVLWAAPKYFERGLDHERDLPDLLTDEVKEILANHTPAPLSPAMTAQIERYLASL